MVDKGQCIIHWETESKGLVHYFTWNKEGEPSQKGERTTHTHKQKGTKPKLLAKLYTRRKASELMDYIILSVAHYKEGAYVCHLSMPDRMNLYHRLA